MPPLLAIVGETASGKSALALALAERLGGEIICADSWTVYRGFDIGTAKPSQQERRRVPHHLLDIADAEDGFSAPQFQRLANQAISDISGRGKLPIMVGGTGLYIDSVLFDYSFLPPSDPALRQELNAMSLADLLVRADKMGLASSGIDQRNKRRVIRLIENNGQLPTCHQQRDNSLVLGLQVPRAELEARIEQRVDAMLAAGLEDEVRQLAARYGWQVEPMKGIGYQEWQACLAGAQDIAEVRQRIIKDTRDLAKRQRTWFRRPNYRNSSAFGLSFWDKSHLDSRGARLGEPCSSEQDLSQKSPSQNQPPYGSSAARNTFIHWLDNREDIEQIVDLITTRLNK